MDRRAISLCLGFIVLVAGCSGKQVSSSSGDRTSRADRSKSEEVLPDAIKTIPLERSFDRPSGNLPADSTLTPIAASGSHALGDVLFDFDRSEIRKDAMPILDASALWFRGNANKTALIEGHSDERGTLAYNLVLSEKRARAAKKYLQDLGVPATQLEITSYGETRPSCTQHNEDCYQQNRRAHFVTQ